MFDLALGLRPARCEPSAPAALQVARQWSVPRNHWILAWRTGAGRPEVASTGVTHARTCGDTEV